MSEYTLWDRFSERRNQGLPGIPREELIKYIWEAAETLDFMNTRHQIQHLDIKPQNLLLVFNHVKIAKFTFPEMLESVNAWIADGADPEVPIARASITGAVTPVYASPETFEGQISPFSDQYSLAIIYQELLTGNRPFNGKNTRELLMQHMNGTPDLSSLPVCDWAIVGRALSKNTDDRYPSCRAFVNELRRATDEPLLELFR